MSPIVLIIVAALVGLFVLLSLLPFFYDERDSGDAFVHLRD